MELISDWFPRLKERIRQKARSLSDGEQQMLTIGRALMNQPRFILLDEPIQGLASLLVQEMFYTIEKMKKERGLTILLLGRTLMLP